MFPQNKKSKPTSPLTPDELLSRMENFCAYRERCPKEVRAKLKELGADRSVAQEIFDVLLTNKFFDEHRFAHAYAGGKFRNNHWGKIRIRLELRMRDISAPIVEEALEAIEQDLYDQTLFQLLQKKMKQYKDDAQVREKSAASLIRAGYEPELVFKFLKKIN